MFKVDINLNMLKLRFYKYTNLMVIVNTKRK